MMSDHTTASYLVNGDGRMADIREWTQGLERLENKPLQEQRFIPTNEKSDNLNKLALGAKVERALGRRMTSQDAVMRKPVPFNEKDIEEGRTATPQRQRSATTKAS